VTLRPRQPGSSFKPVVYSAGFLKGYTPTTVLYDVVTTFKTEIGKDYEPHNYDDKEHGPVTVRQALAGSLNIPAVKMIYLAGVSNVLDLAEKMGYSTLGDRSRFGLSLVLGGGEVKLLEHATAFAVFAREGKYLPPAAILRVEDAHGRVLEEWAGEAPQDVFDAEIARQINSILSDNGARAFIFGEQNHLTLPDRPVAAKTGTTNDFRDAWTIGYTPSLVTGVWVGNNNNKEMKQAADGSRIAAPIWNQYMRAVLSGTEVEPFTEAQPVVTGKPVLDGQSGAGLTVKIDKISGKLAGAQTPPQTIVEKTYKQTHNILFYVNKDDPRGPAPANPADDWQFAGWEAALGAWASKQGFIDEVLPTEYDDVHLTEDKPILKIMAPADGETVRASSFGVLIEASSRRGVKRVELYLDGRPAATIFGAPWNQVVTVSQDLSNGFHNLRAAAFDDLENNAGAEVTINLLR
jgi:membrane carboxypeptidase/penicillin-binding protein